MKPIRINMFMKKKGAAKLIYYRKINIKISCRIFRISCNNRKKMRLLKVNENIYFCCFLTDTCRQENGHASIENLPKKPCNILLGIIELKCA